MKTFNLTIDSLDMVSGLDAISLVLHPAIEYDFLAFSEDKPIQLKFEDDEKHIITGIAILADTPILRTDKDGNPFQVVFTKEVIRQLVEKYSKFNLNNSVNLHHSAEEFVDNVIMIESYIIDKKRGICPIEFSDVTDGSWVVSFKIENLDVWERIKSGELKGFSVQGIFDLEQKFSKSTEEEEILALLDKIHSKIKNKRN